MIVALQTLVYFRESLLDTLGRWIIPVFKNLAQLTYNRDVYESDDEESEDHVYADYDDEKGVVFYPPVYAQRYAAVTDCLMDERWSGQLEKIVDLGYNDMTYIKYLKDVYGVRKILGVDLECVSLRCISDLFSCEEHSYTRETPIEITLFQGNAADPDYRLIGCDAVVAIELIEHMKPHDLDRLVHTIFGFIKPRIAVITTPNGDFNVLFKALEKNGLRRMDHFFEWTREQFHDWCGNIVERYPDFTVTSKGIGPGPPNTASLGCCSQMALFVNNAYCKQHDLDMNSLSVMQDVPDQNITELIGVWENSPCLSVNESSNSDSFYDLLEPRESTSLMDFYSDSETTYTDNSLQCNIENELARNYLMFEIDQMYINVLVPRRKVDDTRVYKFENIASRLNCTTLQVKKFSKQTQNLMAKNKLDTLVHTREVVNKLKIVSEVLNINNETPLNESTHIWNNINWGDNAPYWNQFYKVVKQYSYPFERKTDDTRILECVSDEVNRLVDLHEFDDRSEDSPHSIRLEIPINQLMNSVQNITDDVGKVKELLEWNGYDVVGSSVIYSGPPLEVATEGTRSDKWQEEEPLSEWDVAETVSLSDRSASQELTHANERRLRRALDMKVRTIRHLVFTDKDLTREFENVLCRLMKMSLKASKRRQYPPPAKWILSKLYDLLTLTEQAIKTRKKKFIDNFPLRNLEYYGFEDNFSYPARLDLLQFKDDTHVNKIMEEYQHLVDASKELNNDLLVINFDLEDDQSSYNVLETQDETDNDPELDTDKNSIDYTSGELTKHIDGLHNWFDDSSAPEDVAYSDCSKKIIKFKKQHKITKGINELGSLIQSSKSIYPDAARRGKSNENRFKKTSCRLKIQKNVVKEISVSSGSLKTTVRRRTIVNRTTMKQFSKSNKKKPGKSLPKTVSYGEEVNDNNNIDTEKLDGSIDEFGRPEDYICTDYEEKYDTTDISSKEVTRHIEIVTESGNESIALSYTTTTEVMNIEEKEVKSVIPDVVSFTKQQEKIQLENEQQEAIFIFDINEPSTSKGVRHSIADAQCGSDVNISSFSKISATTSDFKLPKPCPSPTTIGASIGFSPYLQNKSDYGTTMSIDGNALENDSFLFPSKRSVGIKIKDSDTVMLDNVNNVDDKNEELSNVAKANAIEDILNSCERHISKKILTNTNKQLGSPKPENKIKSTISSPKPLRRNTIDNSRLAKPLENKNTNYFNRNSSLNSNRAKFSVLASKNLKCGGLQVHSFKQKATSEDVLYHGEWQNNSGRFLRKKCYNSLLRKEKTENISPEEPSDKPEEQFQTLVTKIVNISPDPILNKKNKKGKECVKQNEVNGNTIAFGKAIPKMTPCSQVKKIPRFAYGNKKSNRIGDNKYNNLQNKVKPTETNNALETKSRKTTRRNTFFADLKNTKHKLVSGIPDTLLEFQANVASSVAQVFRNKIKCTDFERAGNSKRAAVMNPNSSLNSIDTISYNSSKESPNASHKTNLETVNPSPSNQTKTEIHPKIKKKISNNKKNKISNLTNEQNIENKENIPHSDNKNVFGGKQKVYMARYSKDVKPISKQPCKVPGNFKLKQSSPSMTKRHSVESNDSKNLNSDDSLTQHHTNLKDIETDGNLVIVVDPNTKISIENNESNNTNSLNDSELGNQVDNVSAKEEIVEAITQDIKSIEEEQILGVTTAPTVTLITSDTEESRYYTDDSSIHGSNSSNTTFNTVLQESNLTNLIQNSIFETTDGSVISGNETIVLANHGTTSYESFSAMSKKDESLDTTEETREGSSSVRDIFDRKDLPKLQVFSGFSINAEPESGDQPSYVCSVIINSDTGSMSLDRSRLAASDDLSGSNFSMVLNEEEVVPDWLFEMIQNHQSNERVGDEEDNESNIGVALIIPIDMPGEPARFDINGNVEPGVGAGTGAGDGRGMHSDHSHDSSGQGTSLSSTDSSSSGERSETVIIDASGFASHYEMLREAIANNPAPSLSIATNNLPATSRDTDAPIVGGNATSSPIVERPRGWNSLIHGDGVVDGLRSSSHDLTLRLQRLSVTSDIDADVSSLDTDAVDSDN